MVGKLHLGLDSLVPWGRGVGLEERGHLGVGGPLVGPLLRLLEPPLDDIEHPAGGPAPRRDVAAAAERGRGVRGQVAGHQTQVLVAGPAEADRPGQRHGGRPGQVAEEVQLRLHDGVLVVEFADGVAAPFGLRLQPRHLRPQRIGAIAVADLDVQQGQAGAARRDPDRRRIQAGRQAADHDRPAPRRQRHHAPAARHPGAVPEDGHRRDRRIQTHTLSHRFLP